MVVHIGALGVFVETYGDKMGYGFIASRPNLPQFVSRLEPLDTLQDY